MDPSGKTLLRRTVRQRILASSPLERREADLTVVDHLLQLVTELGAGVVLGYFALADEVRIDGFLAGAVQKGVKVLLPYSGVGTLRFRRWRPTTGLERDGEGVWSPVGDDVGEAALRGAIVVVPGRAFDPAGGRLGRGGGYYDRLLARARSRGRVVVGAAYECQVIESVPREPHDMPVDLLATERGVRRSGEA